MTDAAELGRPVEDEPEGSGRIVALTDAVVAIALTLLALDLKPDAPKSATSAELAHALHEHAGQYIAFVIAFFLIAQYWFVHHSLMRDVRRVTPALLWATLLFLFGITVVPLSAYLTGDYANRLAVVFFAANMTFISLTLGTIGEIKHRRSLDGRHESDDERLVRRIRSIVSVGIPVLVAAMSSVLGGSAAWLYLLFFFADQPGRVVARRRAAR